MTTCSFVGLSADCGRSWIECGMAENPNASTLRWEPLYSPAPAGPSFERIVLNVGYGAGLKSSWYM